MNGVQYDLITSASDIPRVAAALRLAPAIGLDTETTGLDPHTCRLRLLQLSTPQQTFLIDLFEVPADSLAPVFAVLEQPEITKVAHNAKFDSKFLRKHYNVSVGGIFDTYLASLLVSAGSELERHSLEAVAQRHLNLTMDKEAQVSDWSGNLAAYQLDYAANDAVVMLPLRDTLLEQLNELDLNVAAQLEFDCIEAIAEMELHGVYLDSDRWRAQIGRVQLECDDVARTLQEELGRGASQLSLFDNATRINLESPQQVRDALLRIGIEVESTSEWHLRKLAGSFPIVERLLHYRGLSKNLSSFGEGMLEFINFETHRIHADFRQIGSPTGRITCSSPSLQQVPHAVEYRSCFRAPEGHKLVVADFSQIEMRILAELSGDAALIRAFNSGADLHRSTASQMYGIALAQVSRELRESAKGLNYGIVYGMGAEGLAGRIGTTVEEAGTLIDRYFDAYPEVDRWLRNAADRAVEESRSRSASGRLWVFRLDPLNREELGQLRRVGKNAPIQGTGSDIFKRAMTLTFEALQGLDARIVNSIHDEIVVECAALFADEIARRVEHAMVSAGREFLSRVPVVVDVKVSDTWE
jgi:DNA polymerase-1